MHDHGTDGFIRNGSGFKVGVHGGFVLHGDCFHGIRKRGIVCALLPCTGETRKVDAAIGKTLLELVQQCRLIGTGRIHLIDEDESGHLVTCQQSPQRLGMTLNAVGAGDHQNRIVEYTQGAFRFGGEIDVAWSVKQGQRKTVRFDDGRFGEDGDAALTLHCIRVEKRIAMIHTAKPAHLTGGIEQRLRQCGLTRIHMCQNAGDDSFHNPSHRPTNLPTTYTPPLSQQSQSSSRRARAMPPSLAMCQRSRMAQRPNYSSLWVNHLARKPLRVPKYPATGTITPFADFSASQIIQSVDESSRWMPPQCTKPSSHWNNHPCKWLLTVPISPVTGAIIPLQGL